MIVMKFGGTSVGSPENIAKAVALVKKEPREKVVVVSAMTKVTDSLTNIANAIIDMPTSVVEKEVLKFQDEIYKRHKEVLDKLVKDDKVRKEAMQKIGEFAEKLKITLLGVGYLEDLTPKSLDYILSFGERFSSVVVAAVMRSKGMKAVALTGYEAGIITDSNFGCARPISMELEKNVKSRLMPFIEKGITPVVTGFIAADRQARMTTLGRGGSDYSASLLGRYLAVEEVQIWTDVDGIMSTDPNVVKNAKLIKNISYVEAMDLAYFGAKVIHSKMIAPAMGVNIPVRVKNTFNPDCEGTLIVMEQKKIDAVVKAVAINRNVEVVNIEGIGMAETPNIAGRIFTLLGENNVNIVMISGSSESNLSFVIDKKDVDKTIGLLRESFGGNGVRDIGLINDVCMITVVGAGMRGTKGIAAKIFDTVSNAGGNIIMIAQGSSEVNIAFVIKNDAAAATINALHKRFVDDA